MEAPTQEAIVAFVDEVNRIRHKSDLPRVETWHVMESEPNIPYGCLSAMHLIGPLQNGGGDFVQPTANHVGSEEFCVGYGVETRLICAGLERADEGAVVIPSAIRAVTDYFDALARLDDDDAKLQEDLRDRFVAAGFDAV